jgi:hypothetical protein
MRIDCYEDALREIIKRKAAGEKIIPAEHPKQKATTNLIDALRESLQGRRRRRSTAGLREALVSRRRGFGARPANPCEEATVSKLYPLVSILMALALALVECAFFFQGANWEGPSGPFAPDRLGFNLAWLTLIYLSFQLLSIPLAIGARERFIGVLDGMASVVPFGVSLVVIFGKPELLGTPQR